MLIIQNLSTDPYFNLAAEEYLLKNFDEDIFTLWRNDNAIIVGKHQNALAEINLDYVQKNEVKVIRRLSGGGTVFHDLGNLNFTFITNTKNGDDIKIDFKYFTTPIIEALKQLDVHAEFSGRNDLLIEGQKFSGNAEHIYHQKKRTLHHGTLLFASKIADLSAALKVNPLKFEDKAVKSVRSRVTNISSHLKHEISVDEFYKMVVNYMANKYEDVKFYEYSTLDMFEINKLAEEKYKTWEWNFGYSPKYTFQKTTKTSGGFVEIYLFVEKGIIEQAKIHGDFFNAMNIEDLEQIILKNQHNKDVLYSKLMNIDISSYILGVSLEELIDSMF